MNRLTKELESQQSGQKKEIYRRDDEMDGYMIGNKKSRRMLEHPNGSTILLLFKFYTICRYIESHDH